MIECSNRFTDFIPQSATLKFFRTPMPAISHFSRLGYSPLIFEYSLRSLETSLAEFKSFTTKKMSSAYAVHRNLRSKMFRHCLETSFFDLIKAKSTSNVITKRHAKIGPLVEPLFEVKSILECDLHLHHMTRNLSIKFLSNQ